MQATPYQPPSDTVRAETIAEAVRLIDDYKERTKQPFDLFELAAAVLLGGGAVLSALSSYQSGNWGGSATSASGEVQQLTTDASEEATSATSILAADHTIFLDVKKTLGQAQELDTDPKQRAAHMQMAKYTLVTQISQPAYLSLGLPPEYRGPNAKPWPSFPDDQVIAASKRELGKEYTARLYFVVRETGKKIAQKKVEFDKDSAIGSKFSRIGLGVNVCLVLGGLSIVFKTRVRWAFWGMALVGILASLIWFLKLPKSW